MSEAAVLAIISGIVVVLGSAGFWGYRQYRREEPVKKRDASVVVAHTSQEMALELAGAIRAELAIVRTELNTERGERQALAGRLEGLETHVREQDRTITGLRALVDAYQRGWADLERRWAMHRLSEHAPEDPTNEPPERGNHHGKTG